MRRITRWARGVNWWLVAATALATIALGSVVLLSAWAVLPVVLIVLSLELVILAIR